MVRESASEEAHLGETWLKGGRKAMGRVGMWSIVACSEDSREAGVDEAQWSEGRMPRNGVREVSRGQITQGLVGRGRVRILFSVWWEVIEGFE